ncbi:hypothetical protein [Candidatus Nitrospira salsa]|nr:MAG: hypothetical protein NPIRA01_16420 [Nitrospirales bacterium]
MISNRQNWKWSAYPAGWALGLGLWLFLYSVPAGGTHFSLDSTDKDQQMYSNRQTIIQNGVHNKKTIRQRGEHLDLRLEQHGDRNDSDLQQDGTDNKATSIQRGDENTSRIRQRGAGNKATIIQRGSRR